LLKGNKIFSDLNIGIAPFDVEHKKPEDILRDADIAMHHAKATNSGVAVFDNSFAPAIWKRSISKPICGLPSNAASFRCIISRLFL
jgi:predicted signal transduction protein with EAL and GGDEF domain